MGPVRLGILCPADIAYRRFLPALSRKKDAFTYVGVAAASAQEWAGDRAPAEEALAARRRKLDAFTAEYGGKVFPGYEAMLDSDEIDAVYIPLPPGLHADWGRKALLHGKHLLMEKPFTVSPDDTAELLKLAGERGLAVHENYMFLYHSQLAKVKELIAGGDLGDIRLMRMAFGFPKRDAADFRYSKAMGGGALLDCGGYPLRLAWELLGGEGRVTQARLTRPTGYEIDLYGNAVLENAGGQCAQISFGMDNAYQCQLEVWGSRTTLIAPRIFTAGAGFAPELVLRASTDESVLKLPADDQFMHSIERFARSIADPAAREEMYGGIYRQAELMGQLRRAGDPQ